MNTTFLNAKEKKQFISECEEQFGSSPGKDLVYFKTSKEDVFIVSRAIEQIDTTNLRVNSFGLYIAEWKRGVRLSIEGSELVGKTATKSVVELSDEETAAWIKGEDIYKELPKGVYIIKHGDDFIGCARSTEGRLINHVPKTRRIMR